MSIKIIPSEFDEEFLFENFSTSKSYGEALIHLKYVVEKLLRKRLCLFSAPYIRLVLAIVKKESINPQQEKILIFLNEIERIHYLIDEPTYYYVLFHLRTLFELWLKNKSIIPDIFYKLSSFNYELSFENIIKREKYTKVYLVSKHEPDDEKKYHRIYCKTYDGAGIVIILSQPWNKIFNLFYTGQIIGFYNLQVGQKEYIYVCDNHSLLITSPDIIIDVTDIKNCIDNIIDYKINRLIYSKSISEKQIIGNIVNRLLDELLLDNIIPDDNYLQELILEFKLSLAIAGVSPKNIIDDIKMHLNTILKSGLIDKIKNNGIFSVEPTFISKEFGITGRIDVFLNETNEIIELKTGKPKNYGTWINDETQTALYSLITMHDRERVNNVTVFYSKDDQSPFRSINLNYPYSYTKSIIRRNEMINFDRQLTVLNPNSFFVILNEIILYNGGKLYQSSIEKIKLLRNHINKVEHKEILINYLTEFISFCERERYFQKNEFASLWTKSENQKRDEFTIIGPMQYLTTANNNSVVVFSIEDNDSKFREGDICIIYDKNEDISKQQIFKGTIKSISRTKIEISLKNKGAINFLKAKNDWYLEADYMDVSMRKNIWALIDFALSNERIQRIILGLEKPLYTKKHYPILSDKLTEKQKLAIIKSINAEDYHLIQGPPGTGKTMLLAHLLSEFVKIDGERILVTAFTNRAVDEIISKFITEGGDTSCIVRLGNEFSTEFPEYTIQKLIKNIPDEKVTEYIHSKKIFFSTVATASYHEILQMLNFTTSIVDESSQLIEPEILSVILTSKKFILIGDEKQLPAVISQTNGESDILEIKTDSKVLNNIGLKNLENSLFERLIFIGKKNKWDSYTLLDTQFRMHNSIIEFSNEIFYENSLITGCDNNQLLIPFKEETNIINSKPVEFFDIRGIGEKKKNKLEADILISLLEKYYYHCKKKDLGYSFGVIAPFRAQVSYISQELNNKGLNDIKVDTVERFQGGERDIIFISFTIYHHSQISQIKSLQEYDDIIVDRKLNVALTRAKRKLVLLGNANLLSKDPIYNRLIAFCKQKKCYHSYSNIL